MGSKKLSEELEHCLECNCAGCPYFSNEAIVTCRSLLESAHEKIKAHEDLEEQGRLQKLPCAVGDVVYYRHGGNKIDPMCVEEISIVGHSILLTLEYFGSEDKLEHWRVSVDSTAFDNDFVFHTQEKAEACLHKINRELT